MTILRRISDTLLVGLILVVLFGVVLGRVVPLTGRQTLVIGGGSMEPVIQLGAAAVVEPVTPTAIVAGDVVSLRTGPELATIFTHRVMRVVERPDGIWLATKGDANESADPSLTPAKNVIGRVAFSIPYAGYLITLLSMPSGVLLVVLVALLLWTLTWLVESLEIERLVRARPVVGGGRSLDGAAGDTGVAVASDPAPALAAAKAAYPLAIKAAAAPVPASARSRARSDEARAARARTAREARLRRRGAIALPPPTGGPGYLPD